MTEKQVEMARARKFCPHCGSSVGTKANFCENCGRNQTASTNQKVSYGNPSARPQSRTSKAQATVAACLVASLLVAVAIGSQNLLGESSRSIPAIVSPEPSTVSMSVTTDWPGHAALLWSIGSPLSRITAPIVLNGIVIVGAGSVMTDPVGADGVVYVGLSTSKRDAFDSGGRSISGIMIAAGSSGGTQVWKTEILASGKYDSSHTLVALDVKDGSERWRLSFTTGLEGPLLVAGDSLYFASGSSVHALDRLTGKERWRAAGSSAIGSSFLAMSEGTIFHSEVYDSGKGRGGGEIVALAVDSGNMLWRSDVFDPGLSVDRGVVYAGNQALDASSGEWLWKINPVIKIDVEMTSDSAALNGMVYFGAADGLHAIDGATGKEKWKFVTAGAVVVAQLSIREWFTWGLKMTSATRCWRSAQRPESPTGGFARCADRHPPSLFTTGLCSQGPTSPRTTVQCGSAIYTRRTRPIFTRLPKARVCRATPMRSCPPRPPP